jgi:hypothetical protein
MIVLERANYIPPLPMAAGEADERRPLGRIPVAECN